MLFATRVTDTASRQTLFERDGWSEIDRTAINLLECQTPCIVAERPIRPVRVVVCTPLTNALASLSFTGGRVPCGVYPVAKLPEEEVEVREEPAAGFSLYKIRDGLLRAMQSSPSLRLEFEEPDDWHCWRSDLYLRCSNL